MDLLVEGSSSKEAYVGSAHLLSADVLAVHWVSNGRHVGVSRLDARLKIGAPALGSLARLALLGRATELVLSYSIWAARKLLEAVALSALEARTLRQRRCGSQRHGKARSEAKSCVAPRDMPLLLSRAQRLLCIVLAVFGDTQVGIEL